MLPCIKLGVSLPIRCCGVCPAKNGVLGMRPTPLPPTRYESPMEGLSPSTNLT